jgi:hypothetical protein
MFFNVWILQRSYKLESLVNHDNNKCYFLSSLEHKRRVTTWLVFLASKEMNFMAMNWITNHSMQFGYLSTILQKFRVISDQINNIGGASHYGWRLTWCWFPPIKLQETKSSAPQPFTLGPKSKDRHNYKCSLLDEGNGFSKEVWVGREWEPKVWSKGHPLIFIKNHSLAKYWPLNRRGCFGQGIKWDAPLGLDVGLGLWRLHTVAVQVERPWSSWPFDASHYARPKAPHIYRLL